jgi:hypothetical protein
MNLQNEIENSILNHLLTTLHYPTPIDDARLFIDTINSPTQLRTDLMIWLFYQMEPQLNLITQSKDPLELFKLFSIHDTKDNILALSTPLNNIKSLLNLITFTIQYIQTKQNSNPHIEINKSLTILDYFQSNKLSIFKDSLRLFIPQPNEHKISPDINNIELVNNKNIQKNIENTRQLVNKLEQKLQKLYAMNIKYEDITRDEELELKKYLNAFDKSIDIFLKDFNTLYEKELKYISDDKKSKLHLDIDVFYKSYSQLEEIAHILEEIFAMHNKIVS